VTFNKGLQRSISSGEKYFFLPEIIPTGSGAHPDFYQIHTGDFSPTAKRPKCEADCHIHVELGLRMSGTVCPFPTFL